MENYQKNINTKNLPSQVIKEHNYDNKFNIKIKFVIMCGRT